MMKRVLVLLSVVALMMVMLAMTVGSAFAAGDPSSCAKQLAKSDPISIRACLGHS
jgi:hypothetical protein